MFHFFLVSMVSDEKCTVIKLLFPYKQYLVFLLLISQIFSLCLVYHSLIIMWLGMDFFEFIFFEILWTSWICRFMDLTKFGTFSAISSNVLSAWYFLLSFWNFSDTNVRDFIVLLPLKFCSWDFSFGLFRLHSLCLVPWSSLTLYSTIEPAQWVLLFLSLYFSALQFFNYFLTSCVFSEIFCLCMYFKVVCLYFLEHFVIDSLRSLSDDSNICVISELVSINCIVQSDEIFLVFICLVILNCILDTLVLWDTESLNPVENVDISIR